MTAFRIFLFVIFVALSAYTLKVGTAEGWNLVPLFFAEIQAVNWQGQFNFDFAGFLLLSGLWCVWRNDFTPTGWLLGILGATGGMLFLCAYLLFLSSKTGGDIRVVMLGERRAST